MPWVGPRTEQSAATAVLSSVRGVAMATAPGDGEASPDDVASVGATTVVLSLGRAHLRPVDTKACFVTGAVEIDTGARPPTETMPGDALVVNEREAIALTSEPDADGAARALARVYETAIVTTGAGGALGVRADRIVRSPAPEVDVADATGAGDLFVAAIVWATDRGLDSRPRSRGRASQPGSRCPRRRPSPARAPWANCWTRAVGAASARLDDHPPIDAQQHPRHERGFIGGEVDDGRRHLIRLPDPADRVHRRPQRHQRIGIRMLAQDPSFIPVRIVPGMIAFTRMPCGAYSTAACCVRALMPPLLAA